MDAKDLRTETALSERNNDGMYSQSGVALQCNRNKAYQDIGSNPLAKVESAAVRPCAVIGPDRVVPPPVSNDAYLKKGSLEPWPCQDNAYLQPSDYPHKMSNQNQTRNISPRQTFQENMQHTMVPPTYNNVKQNDDAKYNHIQERSAVLSKNVKPNMAAEAKYCDVPYSVPPLSNELKNIRENEMCVSSANHSLVRTVPHGWPPNSGNLHGPRTYGTHEIYQYQQYNNCVGPRPPVAPMARPHRTFQEESSYGYPDSYFQDPNVRFKPYPVKERLPQPRYDYYSNHFHPPPPFPSHKYDIPKPGSTHHYPVYPHLKYLDNRGSDPPMEGYQRPPNQPPSYNMPFRNQVIHPTYAPSLGTAQNKMLPYPMEGPVKQIISNKLPYENNKVYIDYENARAKPYSMNETYLSEINRIHPGKSQIIPPNQYPAGIHTGTQQFYRKDIPHIKSHEFLPHFRNFDPALGGYTMLRHAPQYSPNTLPISPTDSNASNDNSQTQGNQEDCGYVSQSSTASIRSVDLGINRMSGDYYKRYDYRYGPIGHPPLYSRPELRRVNSAGSKDKKTNIDVRQFLQMWNEGEEENGENNNAKEIPTNTNDMTFVKKQDKQEQLYVLGLVNVPSEELSKYEHIQKVSKLPENIKGYNSIELLNQFEEAIESSNRSSFKSPISKEFYMPTRENRNTVKQIVGLPRPLSPLDVEAKISQSVIHKEVGCNFEIKPCSPKMMNVEIPAPIQNVLGERVIEKVSNPLSKIVQSPAPIQVEENIMCSNIIKRQEPKPAYESCKMRSSPFANSNIDSVKTNYSLQDLETNSGVCLASLPRLDNDIELNFPEVNQQFIDANKIEKNSPHESFSHEIKELLHKDKIFTSNSESKLQEIEKCINKPSSDFIEKGYTKLSKYRKIKNSSEYPEEPKVVRTDSVIIKNPENVKNIEENNYLRATEDNDKQIPANLTSHTNVDTNCDVVSVDQQNNKDIIDTEVAIDFSLNKAEITDPIETLLKTDTVDDTDPGLLPKLKDVSNEYRDTKLTYTKNNDIKTDQTLNNENLKTINITEGATGKNIYSEFITKVATEQNIEEMLDSVSDKEPKVDNNYNKKTENSLSLGNIDEITNVKTKLKTGTALDNDNKKINTKTDKENYVVKNNLLPESVLKIDTERLTELLEIDEVQDPITIESDNISSDKTIDCKMLSSQIHSPLLQEHTISSNEEIELYKHKQSIYDSIEDTLERMERDEVEIEQNKENNSHDSSIAINETRPNKCSLMFLDETHNKLNVKNIDMELVEDFSEKLLSNPNKLKGETEENILNDTDSTNYSYAVNKDDCIVVSSKIKPTSIDSQTELELKKYTTINFCKELRSPVIQKLLLYSEGLLFCKHCVESVDTETISSESEMAQPDLIEKSNYIDEMANSVEKLNKDFTIKDVNNKNELESNIPRVNSQDICEEMDLYDDKYEIKPKNGTSLEQDISVITLNNVDFELAESMEPASRGISSSTKIINEDDISLNREKKLPEILSSASSTIENHLIETQVATTTSRRNDIQRKEDILTDIEKNHANQPKYLTSIASEEIFTTENKSDANTEAVIDLKSSNESFVKALEISKECDSENVFSSSEMNETGTTECKSITDDECNKTIDNSHKIFSNDHDLPELHTTKSGIKSGICEVIELQDSHNEVETREIYNDTNILQDPDEEILLQNDTNLKSKITSVNLKETVLQEGYSKLDIIDECVDDNLLLKVDEEVMLQNDNDMSSKTVIINSEVTDLQNNCEVNSELNVLLESNDENVSRNYSDINIEINGENGEITELSEDHNEVEIGIEFSDNDKGSTFRKRNDMNSKIIAQSCEIIKFPDDHNEVENDKEFHDTNVFLEAHDNDMCMNGNDVISKSFSKNHDVPESQEEHTEVEIRNKLTDNNVPELMTQDANDNMQPESIDESGNIEAEEEKMSNEAIVSCHLNEDYVSPNRMSLKRSFSDSALNSYNEENKQEHFWATKRRKIETVNQSIIAENICNFIQHTRRNSISSIDNEENVSFCILIDNECILTDENEQDKICLTEITEDCVAEIDTTSQSKEMDTMIEEMTFVNEKDHEITDSNLLESQEDESIQEESWVEDVACIETVVSDEIAEDVIISAQSSPKDESLQYDECVMFSNSLSEHTDKVKSIYGENMSDDDAQIVDTLFRTPQMDVNKTLLYKESEESGISTGLFNDECLDDSFVESDRHNYIVPYSPEYSESRSSVIDFENLKSPIDKENIFTENSVSFKSNEECNDTNSIDHYENVCLPKKTCEVAQDSTVHSCESSLDDIFTYNLQESASKYISSSPEVSSTTSEEKSSSILLKITNLNGARVSQINEIKSDGKPRCKFTENKDYSDTNSKYTNRPLLTKAAQKYIPPLKESIRDLKVKISLPQQSLLKLKQLKLTKNGSKTLNKPNISRTPKKPKPNFEDVLKSIDDIQIKMHKEKSKKTKNVPKVVIKKNENGSHYASTPNRETYNPDLTGRKWQPWVFLERNSFIDKMALGNKTKAVYSHRKKTYVLAERFKKYKSAVSTTKFVISQPKSSESSGQLKYTIRLKHTY